MKRCLIVGKPNVGKTLFFLNFAEYMGLSTVELRVSEPDGTENTLTYPTARAREVFVGDQPHTTQALHSIVLRMPAGKGKRELQIVDTAGLTDGIHSEAAVRRAMGQTLRAFREASLVIHVVDASTIGREDAVEAMGEMDVQLALYGPLRVPYIILANKMDLPWARTGLRLIEQQFGSGDVKIVPISALERTGFREVRAFLLRHV